MKKIRNELYNSLFERWQQTGLLKPIFAALEGIPKVSSNDILLNGSRRLGKATLEHDSRHGIVQTSTKGEKKAKAGQS